ncbi:MAG: hypothetical protein AAF074_26145, partial [Pseudomonadota bacterium]
MDLIVSRTVPRMMGAAPLARLDFTLRTGHSSFRSRQSLRPMGHRAENLNFRRILRKSAALATNLMQNTQLSRHS